MEQIKFWQNWHKPEKNAYLAGLFMFLFILIYYTVAFFAGNGWTYPWQIINNFETVEVPFYQLLTGLYNFNIGGNNYVNLQEFVGDTISISAWQAYILLAILMAALSVLMAIVSSLKRFWFFALLTILIFLFLLLQMDSLEFFGQYNRYGLIFGLALYILPAYVINNFFDHVGLLKRFIIFFITSTAFLICIYFFAGVENPLFHFISYGLAMPIILSVIFVLIIAHDIVSFFMLIITNSNNEYSKNSDIHFVIITLLYLLSLTFTYLYEIEYIKWDLIYINPFLLLLIAGVIGIWEFRKKRIAYQEIMHFSPVGAFFYVAMASICFATLAYFMATANDAALEAFTELILASQIGFGLTFFIYALVNFFTILHQNQAVYKVLYKPTRMPYFTANLAGFIATLAFFLSANYDMYYEARAAIYNAMGDVAFFNKQQPLAEELYTQSTIYGFKNHHAHYALGSIELQQQKPGEALYYFEEAIKKEPTENAYAIIANLYKSNDKFFEALFTIQDGLKNFPESGRLMSNAALLYNKTAVVDSTLYYLESAAATDQHDAAIANQHGIYALNNLTFTTDSIIDLYQDATTIENMTNLLVLLNYQGETKQKLPFLLQGDTTLSFNEYAYLQNFMTYQADYFDTTQLNSFHEFADDAVDYFSEPMLFNYAISLYKNQQVYQAYERLEQLANQSIDKESFYFKVMGLLALESGAPLLAQEFLENSAAIKNESADLEKPMLMTYLQAQDLETLSSRILINRQRFENKYPTLVKFVDLYAADSVDWLQQSDSLQYLAVKFLPEVSPGLAYEINTPFLRNDALLISGQRALQANNYSQAQDLLAAVDLLDENTLAPRKARLGMKYLWHTQQRDSLSEFINQENPLIDLYPLHFQAKLAEAGGDNDLAEQLYSLAGNMSPFAEDVV
ncbi:MAG: tetratricopeptide repeat protein, partial [Cyclobacteriaceae bacterium]